MKEDGYDHLRAQVKKLCEIAMVRVWPERDGFTPPAQPGTLGWMIVPEPWSYHSDKTLEEMPGFEIPASTFALMLKELEMNKSPEQIAELLQVRFQQAVIDLWEFVGKDIKARNQKRIEEALAKDPG